MHQVSPTWERGLPDPEPFIPFRPRFPVKTAPLKSTFLKVIANAARNAIRSGVPEQVVTSAGGARAASSRATT
jgi:hypothetical protein